MNAARELAACALLVALVGCATTGDPRQGGLFGWSEAKARDRQAEKRAEVAAAESALAREQQKTAQLHARDEAAAHRLAVAAAKAADDRQRAAAAMQIRIAEVRAKASLLENESPTAATASRARKLRSGLEAMLANRALSDADRTRQLHEIEADIDEARASLNR